MTSVCFSVVIRYNKVNTPNTEFDKIARGLVFPWYKMSLSKDPTELGNRISLVVGGGGIRIWFPQGSDTLGSLRK